MHIENQPAGLLFPTVRAGQLFPILPIVSCFVPRSSTRRWENSGTVGTRMATLWRELFGHFVEKMTGKYLSSVGLQVQLEKFF